MWEGKRKCSCVLWLFSKCIFLLCYFNVPSRSICDFQQWVKYQWMQCGSHDHVNITCCSPPKQPSASYTVRTLIIMCLYRNPIRDELFNTAFKRALVSLNIGRFTEKKRESTGVSLPLPSLRYLFSSSGPHLNRKSIWYACHGKTRHGDSDKNNVVL